MCVIHDDITGPIFVAEEKIRKMLNSKELSYLEFTANCFQEEREEGSSASTDVIAEAIAFNVRIPT